MSRSKIRKWRPTALSQAILLSIYPQQFFSGHLNIEAWRQFIQHHSPQKQILKQPTTVETGEELEVKNEMRQLSSTL